jgi:hypothetical protein
LLKLLLLASSVGFNVSSARLTSWVRLSPHESQ